MFVSTRSGLVLVLGALCGMLLASCQSRPVRELAIADAAVKAAQKVKADALAPDAYREAENYYLRAKKDFTDGYFDSCRTYAEKARLSAEKAEYLSLLKQNKLKGGSDVPAGAGDAAAPVGPGM